MKLHKCICTCVIMTIAAMGYVHQRVEIIKAGYGLQQSRESLACLVDQNSKLMYNLSKLESPRHLLASMNGEEIEFANSRAGRKNLYQLALAEPAGKKTARGVVGRFFDIFTLDAEARPRE